MVDLPRFVPSSPISAPAALRLSGGAAVASQQEAPAAVGLRIPRPRRPSPRRCQRCSSRIPRSVRGSGCGVRFIRRDRGSSRKRAMQDRRGKWCTIPRPVSPGAPDFGCRDRAQGAQSPKVEAHLRWHVLFARQLSRSWQQTTRHLASELNNHHNHQRAASLHHAEAARVELETEHRNERRALQRQVQRLMEAVREAWAEDASRASPHHPAPRKITAKSISIARNFQIRR